MLNRFNPIVRAWFRETLGEPSEPQRRGWPAISSGDHTLILAPTGTGKTLAAFLWELNALIREGLKSPLANAVHLVYVSPLKALNNDIQRNLELPLAQLAQRFETAGRRFPEIRVAVRTGDTPSAARARMLRKAPHILITTPESLNIMITTLRGRGMFSGTRAVIVDEIHAVAGTKRGVHLALTLERLEQLCERAPQRIGLSATQRPLGEVARFLGGCTGNDQAGDPSFRPVTVVDCGSTKKLEIRVESPVPDLGKVDGTVWPAVAPLVLERIRQSRTTLVFVNNRAQAERMAARVNALAGEEVAQPYHGSLARERRHALEKRLKAGAIRALVATSSLELGIDIGSVDLVIQLQSPKRVTSALQRIGRSGHTIGAASRGVMVPTFRDDAMELAALVAAVRAGDVERTKVVQNALDVLAQSIVAAVSVEDRTADDLYALVRRAYPYHRLTRAVFDEVLAMLAGKYPSELSQELEPRITWERASGRLAADRAARMLAVISGGTIPDRGLYTVNLADRTRIGELDEEFVHESRVGDVFQLGSTTWRIASVEHDRVIVTPAPGAPARMPFWHGEYGARSAELSSHVCALRRELATGESPAALAKRYACDEGTLNTLSTYVAEQRAATGVVPDDANVLLEQFADETGSVRLVVHAPFGGRVTAPWGMALARRMREVLGDVEIQVQTTDDGLMLRLPPLSTPVPLEPMLGLTAAEAERLVLEEVGSTPLFGARFRTNAARALLLPRGNPRRRMPLWLQRLKSRDLLQTVRQFPSFPILLETYRDVLEDGFDVPELRRILREITAGRIRFHTAQTRVPSPFAGSLQFGFVMDWMYGDDTPGAEQRAALLSLDRVLLGELMTDVAEDDVTIEAIQEVVAERAGTAPRRRARSADELAHLLDRAGDLTESELLSRVASDDEQLRGDPFGELVEAGRVLRVPFSAAGENAWRIVLTDAYSRYAAAFGAEALETVQVSSIARSLRPRADIAHTEHRWIHVKAAEALPEFLLRPVMNASAARREILARHLAVTGPVTLRDIAARYGWDDKWIEARLSEWERTGKLVRGRFRREDSRPQWCSRQIAEIGRRRALAQLRKQIEPVPFAAYADLLVRLQHAHPEEMLSGTEGTAEVLKQLSGVSRPAAAWERDYLRARIRGYEPAFASQVLARGEIVWGAQRADTAAGQMSRVRFFERGTGRLWLRDAESASDFLPQLGEHARAIHAIILAEGASFLGDLQAISGFSHSHVKDALRELVASGLVTNDSIEALREVIRWRSLQPRTAVDPTRWLPADFTASADRRVVQRRPSVRRLPKWRRPDRGGLPPSGWTGRWSLVHTRAILGSERKPDEAAMAIARQWLLRYGLVTRDCWKIERPAQSWAAIYAALKRLEFRGEARRGYFVRDFAGVQFATATAVELLRSGAAADSSVAPFVIIAAGDPANAYRLPQSRAARDADHPRGGGALLVLRGGRIAATVEGRGRRVIFSEWVSADDRMRVKQELSVYLRGERGARYLMLPDIGSA